MFYAVKNGRVKYIYDNWESCKKQVQGFKGAQFKKFKTKQEAIDYMNDIIEDYINDNNKIYGYSKTV